jgi:hypothetical protein
MFVAVLLGRGCRTRNISFFENVGWPVGAELPPPTTTKSFSSVGSRVDLEISTAIKRVCRGTAWAILSFLEMCGDLWGQETTTSLSI